MFLFHTNSALTIDPAAVFQLQNILTTNLVTCTFLLKQNKFWNFTNCKNGKYNFYSITMERTVAVSF